MGIIQFRETKRLLKTLRSYRLTIHRNLVGLSVNVEVPFVVSDHDP